ncbi:hypothetical protein [Nonomuraea sp. LPB2021202275-12-8]|uniref:hypothetical protein n=1 Tax=Nonomuraea sp. LPB2021202275-12-8 TaxID=3120159 RepID=UPI00300D0422
MKRWTRRIPPDQVAELKAFRPIACAVITVYCLGTLLRQYFFPDQLNLTSSEQYLLLTAEAVALVTARATHRDNLRKGVYQQ